MSQSLAQVYLHVVFSTKHRVPHLQDTALRDRAHAYLAATCNHLESPAVAVGGVADHVHALCRLGKTIATSELVRELKRESSKWLKEQAADLADFYWQNGYGAFSISPGHVDRLVAYIATQDEHHSGETYQDEFRRLLTKYRIEWDERYVWD